MSTSAMVSFSHTALSAMFTFLVPTVALLSLVLSAQAQVVVNGQIFTNGLAIVDAPQPGT